MSELVYTIKEAARALGVSQKVVYDLVHRADFPALMVGGRWKVSREMLAEWVKKEAGGSSGVPGLDYRESRP